MIPLVNSKHSTCIVQYTCTLMFMYTKDCTYIGYF